MARITVTTLNDLQGGLETVQGVYLRAVEGKQPQRGQVVSVFFALQASGRIMVMASYSSQRCGSLLGKIVIS
jgi:hypothetical protein